MRSSILRDLIAATRRILGAQAAALSGVGGAVLAVAGIVVDTKDDEASAFYGHFGFIPLQGQAHRMLLPASAFLTK